MSEHKKELILIGWKEDISLPQFKLKNIKAKIDTGAKTSALHARAITHLKVKGKNYVRFECEDESGKVRVIKTPLIEERMIKSSNGEKTHRPVVKTTLRMGSEIFEVELTLINRDLMGFKMLIGREALSGRFVINPMKGHLLNKDKIKHTKRAMPSHKIIDKEV